MTQNIEKFENVPVYFTTDQRARDVELGDDDLPAWVVGPREMEFRAPRDE